MIALSLRLPALLLALFCLIASASARRELYFPLPKGLRARLDSPRAAFLAVLCALALAAAFGTGEALAAYFRAEGVQQPLHAAGLVCRVLLYCLFALYVRALPRAERSPAAALGAVMVVGVIVQAVWNAPVELLFAAVAVFGCMAATERDGSEEGMSGPFRSAVVLAVALTFLAAIVLNAALLLNLTRAQSDELGRIRLDVIRSNLQDTLATAEAELLHAALRAEQLIDADASRAEIEHFILDQRDSMLSDEGFMNIYIAGSDWHIVPGFDAPPDFHAAERVWYLGAAEHPGEVYITEPYKDANTGGMCFTISTLLSDGETVVGMDLNFSRVQESIRAMSSGSDVAAMIVTDSGLIVGYSDMTLVGERATERLPEFSAVLDRVTASQEHGQFRVTLNGRRCVIFSSETSNRWYLILSISADTLYAQSYRQIAALASVNLLMLLVVVVFYALSARSRRRMARVVEKNTGFVGGFADKLRVLTGRVLRLGDARFLREGEEPEVIAGHIREAGEQLSAMADELRSYSDTLLLRQEKAKKRTDSASVPSRRIRSRVVVTLLVTLAVVLGSCVSIADDWGGARLGREADRYENRLNEWVTEQTSILCMFTDAISAQPELMDDYDTAVRWLNSVASRYPSISVCYMANPYAKIPVIMNTGWLPGEDERPETRPWYRTTERAANGMNISAPYLDARTGGYCVTFSRVVYGENDEFLGIFGIDFFLDKLTQVLGESYTSTGYAFLVDSEGVILNHPNPAYDGRGVSVEDTVYAEAYHSDGADLLRDHTGRFYSCLSRRTDSGFTVVAAQRWWSVYGGVALLLLALVALFALCVALIVSLINRLIHWQDGVNAQLVRSAELAESANRAKSQFLSRMSHEIRTPMNAIIGLDSIALRDPDISPHTRDELEKIGASARHLLTLINDILDMSRIESGRMELKEAEFSLRELLEQINVIAGGQCEDKGLRYECRVVGTPDERFVGDDLKLKQVLINILGNSVKFTERPGSVTFTVEEPERRDGRCLLRFTIADTGIGMDKAFLARLFDAFSQEDATTTNKYGGSGLGMAITKRLVDMMGGTILVESEKGVGSTFTVTVPLRFSEAEPPAETEAPPEEETPAASVAGLHVLIAEDQEMNAEVLTDLLDMEGVTSEWAQNGKLAAELFAGTEERRFDAVLMDMRMPVMDGLEATRAIRRLDRADAKTVPIIALTANAFEEDVRACLDAGMNAHLSKPVDIDALVRTLGRLIAEQREGGRE